MHSQSETGEITIALAGDAMVTRKLSAFQEPTYMGLAELFRGADAAFCNLEEERRANRRFLEIETRGENNGCFLEAMEKLGCETAPGAQGRIKLVMPEGLEVRRLYEIAAAQNVQIRRLNHKRDSLEDIFLKAMEAPNGGL